VRRWLPDTLFGRLALLLGLFVVVSHVLVLTLIFQLASPPPPPGTRSGPAETPPPGLPHLSSAPPRPPHGPPHALTLSLLLDIAARVAALLVAAWIAARWLSKPIRQLARAAQQFGRNPESAPLAETGPAECRDAARVFNLMQQRIRRQLDERHRFVAAVSHDLRTPLTRLRLRTESLNDEAERDRLCADIEEMERMIAATLDYLRGAAEAERPQPLDLQSLVESIAEDQQACGHDVVASGRAGFVVGPPSALRRCIVNLVDNAVRYGGAAGLTLSEHGDRVRLEVRDPGPGIPVSEIEHVFEPFYRIERSRNPRHGGTGLGLSIARDIAAACGGRIELRNPEGGGLVACLEFARYEETAMPAIRPPAAR
jgi:signal transduction histidine kinase